MKKLFFVFSLGLVAGFAQADYLLWTVDNSEIESFATEVGDSVARIRFGRVAGDGSWLYAKGESLELYATSGDELGTSVKVRDGLADRAFAVNVADMGGASYSYYIELLNSSGDVLGRTVDANKYIQYSALENYVVTGDLGDVPPAANVWHGSGFEAVPEPSSMALLALGAGLVGLRRKLRKNKKGKRV